MICTTLAIGKEYDDLASSFLSCLTSKGGRAIVSTSSPSSYKPPVESVQCPNDGTYIWHLKRHALRACAELGKGEDVIFMDADHRLYHQMYEAKVELPKLSRQGFFGCTPVIPITGMLLSGIGILGADGGSKEYLDLASAKFGIDWHETRWWGDHLFAISGNLVERFVNFWDSFAEWVRDEVEFERPELHLALSDGVAMAFASYHCGILPVRDDNLFDPLRRCFQHLGQGVWKQGDFSSPNF